MTQEEMNRLVATQIRKTCSSYCMMIAAPRLTQRGEDVDELTNALLNLSSSFAIIDIYGRR